MQLIGLGAVVLFLASLASFLMAFYNKDLVGVGTTLGFLFLFGAVLMLAITIIKRNKTERI